MNILGRLKSLRVLFSGRQAEPLLLRAVQPGADMARIFYPRKRRYPRYEVGQMGLYSGVLISDEAKVVNLSVSGACINTPRELRVGGIYIIVLQGKECTLRLPSTVAWRRSEGGNTPSYRAGLRFLSLAPETVIRLKDFMRTAGEPDERKTDDRFGPSPLRFFITSDNTALLRGPEECMVKKLSIGGMLAETGLKLQVDGRYAMTLHIPAEKSPIRFEGRVASVVERHNDAPGYDTGIEFLAVREEDREKLRSFIGSLS